MIASSRPHRPSLLGVLYAEDFDETGEPALADPDPSPEPEIIEPVFTAAELEAARGEARAAGRAEAEHGLAGSRNQLLALLAAGVAEGRGAARDVAEAAADGVARCLLGALVACLPGLCEHHGPAEVRRLTRALLPALSDEPRITVRINPCMLSLMQDEIAMLDAEVGERVHLVPTPAVAPGDARITWSDGTAVRDTARARAALEEGLAELGLLQQERADA